MVDDSKVDVLLAQWEHSRELGHEMSAEELTGDCPELMEVVEQGIRALKGTDWMFDSDDAETGDDGVLGQTHSMQDDSTASSISLSADDFQQAAVHSGLMSAEDFEPLREHASGQNPLWLATTLISQGKLTSYQASVLLEGREDPLLLDKYVILDTIDSGGMGIVFKALHRTMDRIVALKTLPADAVDSPTKVQRFQREARAAAKLHHSNIVAAFDAESSDGVHFLVMEYVKGPDLQKVVNDRGRLPVDTAVNYVLQAAAGLQHAHAQGIIHRDIKPANLLLDENGTVKVLDMGLARIDSLNVEQEMESAQELTQAGMVMGTVAYMAPEQAMNIRTADLRSDIYSLGCTLHFLITGRPPYQESTPFETLMAHREQPIPDLLVCRDDVPEGVIAVLHRMMAKEPTARFQSTEELRVALEQCELPDAPESRTSTPSA